MIIAPRRSPSQSPGSRMRDSSGFTSSRTFQPTVLETFENNHYRKPRTCYRRGSGRLEVREATWSMTGPAEDRLGDLDRRIAALEARRDDQLALIETEARRDQDTTECKTALRAIEDELAALRARTATFSSDPRHS